MCISLICIYNCNHQKSWSSRCSLATSVCFTSYITQNIPYNCNDCSAGIELERLQREQEFLVGNSSNPLLPPPNLDAFGNFAPAAYNHPLQSMPQPEPQLLLQQPVGYIVDPPFESDGSMPFGPWKTNTFVAATEPLQEPEGNERRRRRAPESSNSSVSAPARKKTKITFNTEATLAQQGALALVPDDDDYYSDRNIADNDSVAIPRTQGMSTPPNRLLTYTETTQPSTYTDTESNDDEHVGPGEHDDPFGSGGGTGQPAFYRALLADDDPPDHTNNLPQGTVQLQIDNTSTNAQDEAGDQDRTNERRDVVAQLRLPRPRSKRDS